MRAGHALALLLLVAPAVPAATPLVQGLDVTLGLVGYDDDVRYAPAYVSEYVGLVILPRALPCAGDACDMRSIAPNQWHWAEARVLRADGTPVVGASVHFDAYGDVGWALTDAQGVAKVLLRAPGDAVASWGFGVAVFEGPGTPDWQGAGSWLVGEPLDGASEERFFGPDGSWETFTLDIVGTGYLVLDVLYGLSEPNARRDAAAGIAIAHVTAAGLSFRSGAAFVGADEPLAAVVVGDDPEIALTVRGSSPVAFSGGGSGFGIEGRVSPGAFRIDAIFGRDGLEADRGYGFRIFGDPAAYQVTRATGGDFRAAPLAWQGVEARAIVFGPHVGSARTQLEVPRTEHSFVMLGATTNPFTEGEIALRHDGASLSARTSATHMAPSSLWSMSQGNCQGTWSAEATLRPGIASAFVGVASADGLQVPAWFLGQHGRLPCA